MSKSLKKFLPEKKRWWALIIIVLLTGVAILTKREKEEEIAPVDYDPETTPTMYTTDATSYVSDSGYTRYYIETTQWYIFDEAKEPNWKFPDGLYGEKFDNDMNVISTFECDSAIYLSTTRLWELIGNVRINNESGDRFMTQHLFWNTAEHKMYSDSFIHIEKSDRIIEGYGFTSDERISDYVVNRPSMIIPASELDRDRRDEGSDTTAIAAPDSMSTGEPRRRPPRPRQGYQPVVTYPSPDAPTPSGHIPGSHNATRHQPLPATPAEAPSRNLTPADGRKRAVREVPSASQPVKLSTPMRATPVKSK